MSQVDPNDYVAYLAMGDLATDIRDFPKAQTLNEQAYKLAKDNPIIFARARMPRWRRPDSNRQTLAGSDFEIDPANPELMREQERYLTITGNYQESAKVGYQVIEKLPRDSEAPVYLAYDLLFMNRYDEAMQIVRRFERSCPKTKTCRSLRDTSMRTTAIREAVAAFTRALSAIPNFPLANSTGAMCGMTCGWRPMRSRIFGGLYRCGQATEKRTSAWPTPCCNCAAHKPL